MFAALLAAAASSAAFVNGGFDTPADLWGAPSAWSATWSGCNTGYPLPAFGPFGFYSGATPCGAAACANLNVNQGCPFVRVVDDYAVPLTGGLLRSTDAGGFACELFSSRPAAVCSSSPQWSQVEQTLVVPGQAGHVGACVGFSYGAVLQTTGTPSPADAHAQAQLLVNGNPHLDLSVYGNSPGVSGAALDCEGNVWRFLPWTRFESGCLPVGASVTVRVRAWSSDPSVGSRYALAYLDTASLSFCCPESPTATASATISPTATTSLSPTVSGSPTATPTVSATPCVTPSISPTATETPPYVGPPGPQAPYVKAHKNVYFPPADGDVAYLTWIADRELPVAKVVVHNSAGEVIFKAWDGRVRPHEVGYVPFRLYAQDAKGALRPLASGIYVVRLVAPGYALTARFAVLRRSP